jgi:hypothetical protein
MRADALRNSNVFGGLLAFALGTLVLLESDKYGRGTPLRMGPGFFPTMLGAVLLVLGILLLIRSLRGAVELVGRPELRALISVGAGLVLFALVMPRFGLAPAIFLLVLASTCASPFSRLSRTIILSAVLTGFSWIIFNWLLALPLPLLSW